MNDELTPVVLTPPDASPDATPPLEPDVLSSDAPEVQSALSADTLRAGAFIDQVHQQYVMTAYAKGLTERRVLYGHVFRNAMLIVIAGFPAAFLRILLTSSLLIEIIFSLDGLGLLSFDALMKRDYPIMFSSLYIYSLLGLLLTLLTDVIYTFVDPRIDFEKR